MHGAAQNGHTATVSLLLEKGAVIEAKSNVTENHYLQVMNIDMPLSMRLIYAMYV